MATKPGGLADVGDLYQSSNATTPPLDQDSPLRSLVHSAQRRFTRSFAREENVEVPEIPDAEQPVVQHREGEAQPTTTVELITQPSSVK